MASSYGDAAGMQDTLDALAEEVRLLRQTVDLILDKLSAQEARHDWRQVAGPGSCWECRKCGATQAGGDYYPDSGPARGRCPGRRG